MRGTLDHRADGGGSSAGGWTLLGMQTMTLSSSALSSRVPALLGGAAPLSVARVPERVVVTVTSGTVLVFGAKAVLGIDHAYGWLGDAMGLGSLLVSIAAVLLVGRWPAVAGVLAATPFLWLLHGDRWLVWWLVAQLVVVVLAAVRTWRSAIVATLGALVSMALVASQFSVLVVGPGVRYPQQEVGPGENMSWLFIQLGLVTVALLLPAAAGVLARAGVAEQLLATRQQAVTRTGSVQAERARLASDLHDVVAHHVSLIAVRAETAPYTHPDLDSTARDVLADVAEDARRALDELRGVLGVLRRAEQDPALAPQPSLRDLPELVHRATGAGDRIVAHGVDAAWTVPDTVGYVVYRVVQEALTNARRHARGAAVEVWLERDEDEIVVSVRNDPGGPVDRPQPGHASQSVTLVMLDSGEGLTLMAERVEALGGVMIAGPSAGGGFYITARVPLTDRLR